MFDLSFTSDRVLIAVLVLLLITVLNAKAKISSFWSGRILSPFGRDHFLAVEGPH